jgi:two-component system response regulator AtoC
MSSAPVIGLDGELAGYLETLEDLRLIDQLDRKTGGELRLSHVIGRSPKMERVFQIMPVIARTDSSVLITGETGTGKDVIAEAIHHASDRAKGLFLKVNCGALPETLLESELFGHQKGAFTGAVENKPGRFRLAHNGTIYLTEIGDLPLSLQVKLLTFLDDKVVHPLGATKGYNVDVRVIAATHRDLEHMVGEGRFRQDLLFRLNVVRLHLPPLRERGDDVHLLMDHFLRTLSSKFSHAVKGFSPETRMLLRSYTYPGNVRELRNIVEYAVNVCDADRIEPRHLPAYLSERPLREAGEQTGAAIAEGSPEEAKHKMTDDDWASAERRMILEALLKASGKKSRAAAILGWGRSTLWRKMKQHGIVP